MAPDLGPVRRVRLLKNYFIMIPIHMMIREIIRPGNSGFDGVLYKVLLAS